MNLCAATTRQVWQGRREPRLRGHLEVFKGKIGMGEWGWMGGEWGWMDEWGWMNGWVGDCVVLETMGG